MPASFSVGTQAIPEEDDEELDDDDVDEELDDDELDEDDDDDDELDDDDDVVVDGSVSPQPATKTNPAPSAARMAETLDRLR